MAVDNMKPPINNRMSGLPNDWPTCAGVSTPNKGKSARGSNEVNGMGTGSKIHHSAHNAVTDAVTAEACDQPLPSSRKKSIRAASGPAGMSQ